MICLYGGTFDPVHYGHLRTALEVQQALGVDQVRLLPCHIPPHRAAPSLSSRQRLKLLHLATNDEPALAIDDRELRRPGPSFMVDTLASVRDEVADRPVSLVLGMDAFLGLEGWHNWRTIPQLAHLVVMQRPGSTWPETGALAELVAKGRVQSGQDLYDTAAGLIFGVRVSQLEISSTRIRQSVARGASPRYLLPDRVLDCISQQGWYVNE